MLALFLLSANLSAEYKAVSMHTKHSTQAKSEALLLNKKRSTPTGNTVLHRTNMADPIDNVALTLPVLKARIRTVETAPTPQHRRLSAGSVRMKTVDHGITQNLSKRRQERNSEQTLDTRTTTRSLTSNLYSISLTAKAMEMILRRTTLSTPSTQPLSTVI